MINPLPAVAALYAFLESDRHRPRTWEPSTDELRYGPSTDDINRERNEPMTTYEDMLLAVCCDDSRPLGEKRAARHALGRYLYDGTMLDVEPRRQPVRQVERVVQREHIRKDGTVKMRELVQERVVEW